MRASFSRSWRFRSSSPVSLFAAYSCNSSVESSHRSTQEQRHPAYRSLPPNVSQQSSGYQRFPCSFSFSCEFPINPYPISVSFPGISPPKTCWWPSQFCSVFQAWWPPRGSYRSVRRHYSASSNTPPSAPAMHSSSGSRSTGICWDLSTAINAHNLHECIYVTQSFYGDKNAH